MTADSSITGVRIPPGKNGQPVNVVAIASDPLGGQTLRWLSVAVAMPGNPLAAAGSELEKAASLASSGDIAGAVAGLGCGQQTLKASAAPARRNRRQLQSIIGQLSNMLITVKGIRTSGKSELGAFESAVTSMKGITEEFANFNDQIAGVAASLIADILGDIRKGGVPASPAGVTDSLAVIGGLAAYGWSQAANMQNTTCTGTALCNLPAQIQTALGDLYQHLLQRQSPGQASSSYSSSRLSMTVGLVGEVPANCIGKDFNNITALAQEPCASIARAARSYTVTATTISAAMRMPVLGSLLSGVKSAASVTGRMIQHHQAVYDGVDLSLPASDMLSDVFSLKAVVDDRRTSVTAAPTHHTFMLP